MNDFSRKLLTEWRKLELPFEGVNFLVAVSGGADSCALALGFKDLVERKKLNNKFIIAHFNHNVRGNESDRDEKFTQNFAHDLGFNFYVGRARKKEVSIKDNLEQTLRNLRYEFLYETARSLNCYAVLTAHTLNDQAETFMFNLLRGSGVEGLSGMRTIRELANTCDDKTYDGVNPLLVRPLLRWAKREDTEEFAKSKEIDYRVDLMNSDLKFSRVKIRKQLLPQLREYNPQIIETLARTSRLLSNVLETSLEADDQLKFSDDLKIKYLKTLTKAALRKILRVWLKTHRGGLRRIAFVHIEAIEKLIHSRKSGKIIELPGDEWVIKEGGSLIFRKSEVEK